MAGDGDIAGEAAVSAAAAGGLVASGVGAAVSVFCSHAARSAAPAKTQMIFFIMLGLWRAYWVNWSIVARFLFGPAKNFPTSKILDQRRLNRFLEW